MKKKLTLSLFSILSILSVLGMAALLCTPAHAASSGDFNPSRIIDDAVFYNANSMNASEIQNFLNAKVPNCDTNGTQSAADWGYPNITHAQLAEYKRNGTNGFKQDTGFHAPPYTCLRNYSQATPQMEAASGYCNAINSGTRSGAQIIKDVATACGINPQVLIVLLNKEQSLITDNWPLQRQYDQATGFACPDTALCSPEYAGFFYQVYSAARQFKVYQANQNSYNYIAGRTNRIYWQTNKGEFLNPSGNQDDPSRSGWSSCGYSNVYIDNQATAALYIYTPYRPNQAALSNLYGTGDGCSAYGNRNFWRTFTDWFGSTYGFSVIPELKNRYSSLGGASGTLGVVTDNGYCNDDRSVCWQSFTNGSIVYNSKYGAWESKGSIRDRWAQTGYQTGYLGYPSGPETTLANGRTYQQFERGRIYWKEYTGAWTIHGVTGSRYLELGADQSYLGYPTSGEIKLSTGGLYQQFEKGRIYYKEGLDAWTIHGVTGSRYLSLNASASYLGYPTSGEIKLSTGGLYQQFEKGRIYYKEGLDAWTIHGVTGSRYLELGADQSYLGYPTSGEIKLSTGGLYQQFEKGRIYYKEGLDAWTIHGVTGSRYLSLNASASYLGYPTSGEIKLSTGGLYQQFEKGRIYYKEGLDAWTIHGVTGSRYLELGADQSYLGYPTSGEIKLSTGGLYQQFEKGRIYYKEGAGAWTDS